MKSLRTLTSVVLALIALCLSDAIAIATSQPVTVAQVIEDTTLGAEQSVVNSITQNGTTTHRITGGATRGTNLFHSFEQFSVTAGNTVIFANSTAIENIISRVTGLEISTLDGNLQSAGSANLFLLNPAGIMIGPNASLDIGGSFSASTGEVRFDDGTLYSRVLLDQSPLLTISAPVGLPVETASGRVTVIGPGSPTQVGIALEAGQTFSLVGGEIALTGARLSATGGRIELRSGGDVQLANQSVIDVTGVGGGTVELTGETITLAERSSIVSDTLGNADGGDIRIEAARLRLQDDSFIGAATLGSGRGGDIAIAAENQIELVGTNILNFKGRSQLATLQGIRSTLMRTGGLSTGTNATGQAGDIRLNAQQLLVDNGAVISAETTGRGNGGNIDINTTQQVTVNGSGIVTNSSIPGVAVLDAVGAATGQSATGLPAGSSGNITINTNQLTLDNGSAITASTITDGNAGTVLIRAGDSVELRGFFDPVPIPTTIATLTLGGTGAGGNVDIETGHLSLMDGGLISAGSGALAFIGEVRTGGPAGNILITANQSIEVVGSHQVASPFFSDVLPSSIDSLTRTQFSAGDIQLTTPALVLQDGGRITNATLGSGDGGSINIQAANILIAGETIPLGDEAVSEIISSSGGSPELLIRVEPSATTASGQGGSVTIQTERLAIRDRGAIFLDSFGTGAAGNLNISADRIQLDNQGRLTARTISGRGGNINLNVETLLQLRQSSEISAISAGTGDGGNIIFEGGLILAVADENSDIIANAVAGNGGRILLTAQDVIGFETSSDLTTNLLRNNQTNDISASSELGAPGEVQIVNQVENPVEGVRDLSSELLGGERLLGQSVCAVGPGSNFVVTGRGGVPRSPQDSLGSGVVWTDERDDWTQALRLFANDSSSLPSSDIDVVPEDLEENSERQETGSPLVEAQGWSRLSDGRIALVAPGVSATIATDPPTCQMLSERLSDE